MTLRIIAGKYKGRQLNVPKGARTRPTQGMVRAAVFNMCQNEIEGACFLDLFAGSGAMGFEALSRGASQVTLVERDRQALRSIQENKESLQVGPEMTLIPFSMSRAVPLLKKEGRLFDMVYIDPPYETHLDLEGIASLLKPKGWLFVEDRNAFELELPDLQRKDVRRFGAAVLSTFFRL